MLTFDEAQALIAAEVSPLDNEAIAFADAAGRVLAAPLHARSAAPRHDASAMDGFAVADATTQPNIDLRVIGEARAGTGFAGAVGAGEAVRIFTGAPLPAGTDRVIMQEHATQADDGHAVRFDAGYGPGWHVRKAGSDFAEGALIVPAGTRLTPRAMVAAAAADHGKVVVMRQPRIAIIATGEELAAVGIAHKQPHLIPESVSHGVAALAIGAGAVIVERLREHDQLTVLERAAKTALTSADLVVVTGGASVGDYDLAKPMFASLGLDLLFNKVAIKPGKPVWLGRVGTKWVLGLPGNPTSAMATARLFLVPLIARLQGDSGAADLPWRTLPLTTTLPAVSFRETFVRAQWGADGLRPISNQDSGAQHALLAADWLIRRPAQSDAADAGTMVSAIPF